MPYLNTICEVCGHSSIVFLKWYPKRKPPNCLSCGTALIVTPLGKPQILLHKHHRIIPCDEGRGFSGENSERCLK